VNGCPNVGFVFQVNPATLGLAPGEHTLQIRVTNARSASTNIPENPIPFTLDSTPATPPKGAIETPAEGAAITGTTTVKGYAYSPDLRILSLDVLIDGVTYGSAAYGLSRPDICGSLDGPPAACPNIGFSYSLNPKSTSLPVSPGSHTLTIRARDELGNFTVLPGVNITVK
jgi:hypothetical protein